MSDTQKLSATQKLREGTSVPELKSYDCCGNCGHGTPIDRSAGRIAGVPDSCNIWCGRPSPNGDTHTPTNSTSWCFMYKPKEEKNMPEVEEATIASAGEADKAENNEYHRGMILEAAIKMTLGNRNEAYGDPVEQLGLAGELKKICAKNYRRYGKRAISAAEWEALDMVLTKLSRAFMGPKITRDTYIDMAAYAAIAGQCAEAEKEDT